MSQKTRGRSLDEVPVPEENLLLSADEIDLISKTVTKNSKKVVFVELNFKELIMKNSISLPLFKFLEFHHEPSVEQMLVVFVCSGSDNCAAAAANLQANSLKYHPRNDSRAAAITDGNIHSAVRKLDAALSSSSTFKKTHQEMLALCHNPDMPEIEGAIVSKPPQSKSKPQSESSQASIGSGSSSSRSSKSTSVSKPSSI
mmetsp:Transcript_23085/g.47206  ORF Transcript_23085/g.47206 Transcript_23085/m.47206 type:complete len:200 (+) Transcript_23085:182-781(+)|eukprot:CAMPEP_0171607468 /NCGR_PEP_ID=MMETSP0990-20121206/8362_1 /TAXON_ID=483369 /ORGANISM="non described non described, Strain CCMP2098" /LENGTH=199 /DNA_ID=CAMNT_0012170473 /DNA_START=184 /DNA_END=783 /DNA_ORIENTATION=+